jgi:hypothetical protein
MVGVCSPAASTHFDPLLGYDAGSQNTCPNEILEICGVFLYGVTMILFLCVKSVKNSLRIIRTKEQECTGLSTDLGPKILRLFTGHQHPN